MTVYPSVIMTSMSSTIILVLALVFLLSSKKSGNSVRKMSKSKMTLSAMKTLSLISLLKLLVFTIAPQSTTSKLLPWMDSTKIKSIISMSLDMNFLFFSTVALFVTWSIMEFSVYYMESDPLSQKFFRLLMMFLMNMLILTSAKNLFMFFMGWEGVGFLSFLLMGWWFTRQEANASALQAIMYKRMGDMGIILLMSMSLYLKKSWDMKGLLSPTQSSTELNMMLLACLLAAMGKSAQFGLHPWLPAAMEGPTPVSALLHSSTMVVAGVFLLMRVTSLMIPSQKFLKMCMIMGSLTAMFAATSAFSQHDMKKMIAYSTTSQLGLMVMAVGLGQPLMALFHICTHAFFKAMLFLCSGSLIHSYKKEQDLRKMSKTMNTAPMTSACLFLGSMALMGMPFLSGFYSKDLMLEAVALSPSKLMMYVLAMAATLLTASYSFRIISFCFLNSPSKTATKPIKEENPNLYLPLIRLAMGAIVAGWLLSSCFLELPQMTPTPLMKLAPLVVTMTGATMSSTLIIFSSKKKSIPQSFFTKTWFFDRVFHPSSLSTLNFMALEGSTRALDRGWSETGGGQGMFFTVKEASKTAQTSQTGYIKQYLLSMVAMIAAMITLSLSL